MKCGMLLLLLSLVLVMGCSGAYEEVVESAVPEKIPPVVPPGVLEDTSEPIGLSAGYVRATSSTLSGEIRTGNDEELVKGITTSAQIRLRSVSRRVNTQ